MKSRRMAHRFALAFAGAALACAGAAGGCVGDYVPGVPAQTGTPQAYDYYPFTAQGYVIRWAPGTNIRVLLPDCMAPNVTGCQPNFIQAVGNGINAWAPVHALLGITITFFQVLSPTHPYDDVRVIWDDGSGSPSGYAIADGVIGFAAIAKLPAALSRFIVMTTRCNICGDTPHAPGDIQAITTHEWGHMLGVWNHSFDPADLMYPYRTGQSALSVRDVATMLKAYSLPPAVDLASLPPNALTLADTAAAESGADPPEFLIRFLHSNGEVPTTTLEFNPP